MFLLLQVDPESGEIISTLSIHNMTKYVFQTYYIIAENYAGKTKHGIKLIQGTDTKHCNIKLFPEAVNCFNYKIK